MMDKRLTPSRQYSSITRNLTLSITLTILLTSTITICINYFNTKRTIKLQREQYLKQLMINLPGVLEIPLWNFDRDAVRGIAEPYFTGEMVTHLQIYDSLGENYLNLNKDQQEEDTHTHRTITVKHRDNAVGRIDIGLSSRVDSAVNSPLIWSISGITLLNIIALVIIIRIILRRSLTRPIKRATEIANNFGNGTYTVPDYQKVYIEFAPFFDMLQLMEKQINAHLDELNQSHKELEERVKKRTQELAGNNQKLRQIINDRERLEHKLKQSEKMEAIGLMAGGVAHDLNNILSGITGYPELILMDLPADSKLIPFIHAIRDSGQRAADVVADLLTIARGVANRREVTDLRDIVRDYLNSPECRQLRHLHPGLKIVNPPPDKLHKIICSPLHINKCIMNLVNNGAEAISSGGTIFISMANKKLNETMAEDMNTTPGDYVRLSVKDSGSGIPAKDLNHIFEPFYSKKVMGRSGTGLGLTVVWNCIKDHAGAIQVNSDSKGTTFNLYFPAATDQQQSAPKEDIADIMPGNGETIMIIDDEDLQRDLAAKMLTRIGYTVTCASSGEEAIRIVKDKPVDLLLLDMIMAPGLSGYETYGQILEFYPKQKAVIASGFAANEEVQNTISLGAGQFIKKPYTLQVLSSAVRQTLEQVNGPETVPAPGKTERTKQDQAESVGKYDSVP